LKAADFNLKFPHGGRRRRRHLSRRRRPSQPRRRPDRQQHPSRRGPGWRPYLSDRRRRLLPKPHRGRRRNRDRREGCDQVERLTEVLRFMRDHSDPGTQAL
jgi:hypothetical protein